MESDGKKVALRFMYVHRSVCVCVCVCVCVSVFMSPERKRGDNYNGRVAEHFPLSCFKLQCRGLCACVCVHVFVKRNA